jgi:antirestriction protein ArdC
MTTATASKATAKTSKTASAKKTAKGKKAGTATATGEAYVRKDVQQVVTDRIILALEGGTIPWKKGWSAYGMPRNYATGRAYQGINAFLLSFSPVGEFPLFLTFKQALDLGGCVRKGEKGETVIFYSNIEGKEKPTGEKGDDYFLMKSFTVFNISQIDGIEFELPEKVERTFTPNETAEALAGRYLGEKGAPTLAFGGSRAYYAPESDHIQMPPRLTFRSEQAYYRTLFHELGHSTGAAHRLNRADLVNSGGKGSASYAREELTAEMTTAFLNAEIGYAPEPEGDQHARYIQNWLMALKNDKSLVFKAASLAQKASYLIKGETPPAYEITAPTVSQTVEAAPEYKQAA